MSSSQHDAGEACRDRQTWLILVAIVIIGDWAGSGLFFAAEYFLHDGLGAAAGWRLVPWLLVLLVVLVMLLRGLFAFRLGSAKRVSSKHFMAIGFGVATTVASVGAALVGEHTIAALANGYPIEPRNFVGGVVYWLFFIAFVVVLFKRRRDLGAVVTFPKQKSSPRRRHLVLFLSNLITERDGEMLLDKDKKSPAFDEGRPSWFVADRNRRRLNGLGVNIQADLKALLDLKDRDASQRWIWEMPLRAIQHHCPVVDEVTIVCSPQSLVQVRWFLTIAHEYFPELKLFVWAISDAAERRERIAMADVLDDVSRWIVPDFEDLDDLTGSIRDLLDRLASANVRDEDIVIDFTGGQKTTSVVAAGITFNRRINAQYVRTEGRFLHPGDDVISFDLAVEPVGAGPG